MYEHIILFSCSLNFLFLQRLIDDFERPRTHRDHDDEPINLVSAVCPTCRAVTLTCQSCPAHRIYELPDVPCFRSDTNIQKLDVEVFTDVAVQESSSTMFVWSDPAPYPERNVREDKLADHKQRKCRHNRYHRITRDPNLQFSMSGEPGTDLSRTNKLPSIPKKFAKSVQIHVHTPSVVTYKNILRVAHILQQVHNVGHHMLLHFSLSHHVLHFVHHSAHNSTDLHHRQSFVILLIPVA